MNTMSQTILKSNFFILTGGPGSGKTSVLMALKRRGFLTMPEVARDIIKEQVTIGGNAMHTGDRQAFLEKMLMHSLDDYLKIQHERTAAFFDRGIPDLHGYAKTFCNMENQQVNNAVERYRYCQTAFIFPPWKEIYINDHERQQDYNESIETYAALKEAYELCGYHLIEIPFLSVENRVDFILRTLTQIVLSDLQQEINQWLGFHENTPRINYGPCGVFSKMFFDAWNHRFKYKVHIVFVMMKSHEECWHVAVRLPTGELYDGGIGLHLDKSYNSDEYFIEDMFVYDHERLEKWSYGLDREYPQFCPDFDKNKLASLINHQLDRINTKV